METKTNLKKIGALAAAAFVAANLAGCATEMAAQNSTAVTTQMQHSCKSEVYVEPTAAEGHRRHHHRHHHHRHHPRHHHHHHHMHKHHHHKDAAAAAASREGKARPAKAATRARTADNAGVAAGAGQ